jgi:diguanylate cyclase (GGDEF)-like protein/PAS domain S-box-containing protein
LWGDVDKETILVVDDNRQLGDFIAYRLLPNLGYQAHIVYDGRSVMAAIAALQPALLLLDHELPDTTGLDLLKDLSANNIRIPAILFTAHGSEQIAAEAFRLGVQDYLVKPVEPEQLQGAIARALTITRLRQETERLTEELKDQVAWLSALSKIGQSLTSSLELDEVLGRIVTSAIEVSEAEEGFIALLDAVSGKFQLRASHGIDREFVQIARAPLQDALVNQAIQTRRPVRKLSEHDQTPLKISTGFLVHSLLYVPIFSRGRPLGILAVNTRLDRRSFTRRDEVVLTSLVDFAAVALENAALYDQARRKISERRQIEAALRESEERYALAANGANDGIWDWNLKTNQIYYSPRWKKMLEYDEGEIGHTPHEWLGRVHPEDIHRLKEDLAIHLNGDSPHLSVEHRVRRKNGAYCWVAARGLAVRDGDGKATRLAGSLTDISERKQTEARLRHDAFTDQLTQLPNRPHFLEKVTASLDSRQAFAILFLDLDGFKYINDSLGHPAGDQMLVAVAEILKQELRPVDLVARLGGDEFVILLPEVHEVDYAIDVAQRIIKRLKQPIFLRKYGAHVSTSASVGIVLSNMSYQAAEEVLRDADIAMYAAKGHGKDTYELYDPGMRERMLHRLALEANLMQAVEQRQLLMYYQPLVSARQHHLLGFEALVQWQHPQHGLLPASEFIPLAQDAGIIAPIDWWAFEEACRQAGLWQQAYPLKPQLEIFINLTGSLMAQPDLMDNIRQVLARTGFDPHYLGLDISESVALANQQVMPKIIAQLREMGIQVCIDNFGVGAGSLLNLKRLAVDGIKVSQAFIQDIDTCGPHDFIAHAMADLAHKLSIKVGAKGIETESQLHKLEQMGYDIVQGFYFSPAVQPDIAARMIETCRLQPGAVFSPGQNILRSA